MHVFKSPEPDIPIPPCDLLTYLYEFVPVADDTPLHAEAANEKNVLNKAQCKDLTMRVASVLRRKLGIGANGPEKDTVFMISSGQMMLFAGFHGTLAAGGISSPAGAALTSEELAKLFSLGKAKGVLCSEDVLDNIKKAAKIYGMSEDRILIMKDCAIYTIGGENLMTEDRLDWERVSDPERLKNSLACILFSSGTTGPPKGVMISHLNMVFEGEFARLRAVAAKEQAEQNGEVYEPMRTLGYLPVAHIAGVQGYLINPVASGALVYWMPRFDFDNFIEFNRKYKINTLFTVPPILLLLVKSEKVTDHFASLKSCIAGAAPLGKELQLAASKKLGNGECFITQTWGMTETTGSATAQPNNEMDTSGSVGRLIPNHYARLVDENMNDVKPGEEGEIIIKGPVVTRGYYNNPKATKDLFYDGWMRTGDVARTDPNDMGRFWICDRLKELIKYNALQIAPAELEALLVSMEGVQDAAVIGVQQEATEVPRAYVVRSGPHITEQMVKDFIKSKAASYKQLRGGVEFVDVIPKSPSGKILRKELRQRAAAEFAAATQAKL